MLLQRKIAGAAALAAAAIAIAVPAGASADPDVACLGDGTAVDGANQTQVEASILCLVNRYRQDNGRSLLSNDTRLASASRSHSVDMNTTGYFAHTDPADPTDTPAARATFAGYLAGVGENIAMNGSSPLQPGYGTAWSLFDQWRKSPGHNANMLATGYLASGVGVDPLCWCNTLNLPGIMGTQMFGTAAANTGDTAMGLNFGPIPTSTPPPAPPGTGASTKKKCKKGQKLKRGKCRKKKRKKK